jgi:beta-barrel assembly-enhancing protease
MKRAVLFAVFFVVLGIALVSLYYTQRREQQANVSPSAILQIAADAQRDITRVPMHLTRILDEEEISIGKELAARYQMPEAELTPEERGLEQYVQSVGRKLAAHAHRPLPFNFHLIPNHDLMNAYSLPGGPVYIGEGMLDLMETEDELASVLAHEVEHIDHYHCVERVQVEANLKHFDLEIASQLIQLPVELWQAGYHKDEELEADREGMFLAVQAGYSPYGSVEMFKRFAKLHKEYILRAESPEEELSGLAIQSLSGYFRSHPLPSERLAQAEQVIAEEHWENSKEQKPFHVEYSVHNGQYVK